MSVVALTEAQRTALHVVAQNKTWRWPSGEWARRGGVHGTTLNNLLRLGLIRLEDVPGEPWLDVRLTLEGRELIF